MGLKNYRNQITRGRELERKEIVVREWTPWDWDHEKIVIIGYEKLYGVYTEGKGKITPLEKVVIKPPLEKSSTWILI